MTVTAGGEMHGLQVYLDVQSDQYLRTNVQSGFKVSLTKDPGLFNLVPFQMQDMHHGTQ